MMPARSVHLSHRQVSDLLVAAWGHRVDRILEVCKEAGVQDIYLLNLPDLFPSRWRSTRDASLGDEG
jgi:hypothetical protein